MLKVGVMMKKVGIMGGTFNPIHIAHLVLAEQAYEQYGLDEIVFMPSKRPAYKDLSEVIEEEYRKKMIELAIEDNPHFTIDIMEFYREGNTYTADTLLELTKKNPEVSYYFIIGADSLFQLEKWYHPEVILSLSTILAANRDDKDDDLVKSKIDELVNTFHAKIHLLKIPKIDISSNMIRECIQEGKSIRYFVPSVVCKYIEEQNLYKK